MLILLNRHNAGFGNADARNTPQALQSRTDCVQNACQIARLLDDYTKNHGKASTLVGSTLYNMTMAATALVAYISEKNKEQCLDEMQCLTTILRMMKDMENTELVARNVRKLVQTIMRVCNVRKDPEAAAQPATLATDPAPGLWYTEQSPVTTSVVHHKSNEHANAAMLSIDDMDGMFPFPFEDALYDPGDFWANG